MTYIRSTGSVSAATINTLLGQSSTSQISFADTNPRVLTGINTPLSQISMGNFRTTGTLIIPNLGVDYFVTPPAQKHAILINIIRAYTVSTISPTYFIYTPSYNNKISPYNTLALQEDFSYLSSSIDDNNRFSPSFIMKYIYGATSEWWLSLDFIVSQRFSVPPGATSVTIEAWGGGGGSGGSWTGGSTPGYGGAGGYATTTLTVGTHIQTNQIIHCFVGPAGAGGANLWYSGTGGSASAVYYQSYARGYPNVGDSDWTSGFFANMNASNCILVAGGGGGGGSVNWSSASGGHGGSGGSIDSGSGAFASGSGTGATTTSHGGGAITPGASSYVYTGTEGGGIYINSSVAKAFMEEADFRSIYPYASPTYSNSVPTAGFVVTGAQGGGGAFQGSTGYSIGTDATSSNYNRGGGGGSSKVYLGSGSTASSGISSTPPNSGSSMGYGYGGTWKGPNDNVDTNRYSGVTGTAGLIRVRFN